MSKKKCCFKVALDEANAEIDELRAKISTPLKQYEYKAALDDANTEIDELREQLALVEAVAQKREDANRALKDANRILREQLTKRRDLLRDSWNTEQAFRTERAKCKGLEEQIKRQRDMIYGALQELGELEQGRYGDWDACVLIIQRTKIVLEGNSNDDISHGTSSD